MGQRVSPRTVGAALVVAVALFATIGEGSTASSGNKAPNADSSSSSKKSGTAAGSDKAKPIAIGDEIKVSSGWFFKVNSAQLNANDTLAKGNELQTPDDGKQYVMVNVSITNKSGKPDSPMSNLKMSLLPSSGIAIDPEFAVDGVPDVIDETTQLQPDAVYTGNVVFQVKTDEAANSLLLVEPQFTVDENGAQRFFSLQ